MAHVRGESRSFGGGSIYVANNGRAAFLDGRCVLLRLGETNFNIETWISPADARRMSAALLEAADAADFQIPLHEPLICDMDPAL